MVGEPETVRAAFAAGINALFISADLHWPLYESPRRGLVELLREDPAVRERIVVGVCSYATQVEFPLGAIHGVLEAVPELGTVDGLITNDKFCLTRHVRLRLRWRGRGGTPPRGTCG